MIGSDRADRINRCIFHASRAVEATLRLRTDWQQSGLLPLGYAHAESSDHSLRLDVVDIVQDRRNPLGLRHGMDLRQGLVIAAQQKG